MQVLAVAHGGRLEQDVTGREGHPAMGAMSPEAILATRHRIAIDPASTLGGIYRTTERAVNTIHHQAVADAGDLSVSARGDDGMIEAVEVPGAACVLGVQWHPEKLPRSEAAAERRLFEHLIAEARGYAARRRANGV
jgi:gamma-glutamyl-gamma-aminobutyrate hydrolase PuuD